MHGSPLMHPSASSTPSDTTPQPTTQPSAVVTSPAASPSLTTIHHQPVTLPQHTMVPTRAMASSCFKPNPKYALTTTSTVSAVPQSVRVALKDPQWREAMQQEFDVLQRNKTYGLLCPARPTLASCPANGFGKSRRAPTVRSSVAKLGGSCAEIVNSGGSTSTKHSPRL
jgi:hypothetical protein